MSTRQRFSELSSVPASRSDHGLVLNVVEDRIRLGLPAAGEAVENPRYEIVRVGGDIPLNS
jgi:hypothetical protein